MSDSGLGRGGYSDYHRLDTGDSAWDPPSSDRRSGRGRYPFGSRSKCWCCPRFVRRSFRKARRNMGLLLCLVGLVVCGVAEAISRKLMQTTMLHYRYLLTFLIPIVYPPIFFLVVAYEHWVENSVAPEVFKFPKRHFLVMAALDALGGLIVIIVGGGVESHLQVLLLQGAIPVTMVASILFLRARYFLGHFLGGMIIVLGIVTIVIPMVITGSTSTSWTGSVMFFLANFPFALSSVYKEYALKSIAMDVYFLNAWVALFQVVVDLPLAPLAALLQDNMELSQIHIQIWNGLKCWLTGENQQPGDVCKDAFWNVNLYIVFNVLFNVFITLVLQRGSALLFYNSITITVPLAFLCAGLGFIMGSHREEIHWTSIVGLVVILIGLFVYQNTRDSDEDDSSGSEEEYDDEGEEEAMMTEGLGRPAAEWSMRFHNHASSNSSTPDNAVLRSAARVIE